MRPLRRSSRQKLGPRPLQTAKIQKLAGEPVSISSGHTKVEQRMLDRIKNCLERTMRPTSPVAEAQAALCMATRLMAQHNVSCTELLDQFTDESDYAKFGTESVVAITRVAGRGSKVISQTWVDDVAHAMETLFDCKCYSKRNLTSITWTFYGIAANTTTAATGFEMAHNLILNWNRRQHGKNAKQSYCLGAGVGLKRIANEEKEKERTDIQSQVQQDANQAGSGGNFVVNPWSTSKALVQFRQSAEKVASEYLRANDIKLSKGRRRARNIRNHGAYQEGIKDSKRINVKQRRIQAA